MIEVTLESGTYVGDAWVSLATEDRLVVVARRNGHLICGLDDRHMDAAC